VLLSPAGKFVSWLADHDGVRNLWIAPSNRPEDAEARTKSNGHGIIAYEWTYSGRHLLIYEDKGGNENHRISSVDAHTGATRLRRDEPLVPSMILSNEPGYYKNGEYGIRVENLVLVVERDIPGAEHPMLGFETLTLVPIDRSLVVGGLLTREERGWLDSYHAEVMRRIGPLLEDAPRAWLREATHALGDSSDALRAMIR
jgi:hypothetical protein